MEGLLLRLGPLRCRRQTMTATRPNSSAIMATGGGSGTDEVGALKVAGSSPVKSKASAESKAASPQLLTPNSR